MENNQTKSEMVRKMFNDIAPTYDKLNHILSFEIDRLWRRRVVGIVARRGAKRILDLATGTGDLAIAMAKRIPGCTVLGADFSSEMLAVARRKIESQGLDERITLSECDAENIDLDDNSVDAATIAFGIRNFEHQDKALLELYRTIRPGGYLVILEFSNPRWAAVRWVYRTYSHRLLPTIGKAVSHNKDAYKYLPESIDQFPNPERFMRIIRDAGFTNISKRSQSFGIAHIYIAQKPE